MLYGPTHRCLVAQKATEGAIPKHLVVLQHGLSGTALDLFRLSEELNRLSQGCALVHSATANEGRTTDGIRTGGARLAEELRRVIASHSTLTDISFVGNSLGGLYTRYAISELLDKQGCTFAGLHPASFVTIGCPHLGVRQFTFLPLPAVAQSLARIVVGPTGEELMLRDRESLLRQMADPQSPFVQALRLFGKRGLYANLWGDFMVPFGTAALESSWGAGVDDEGSAAKFLKRTGIARVDLDVVHKRKNGIAAQLDSPSVAKVTSDSAELALEETMAESLNGCGWNKFAVGFRGTSTLFPFAHNKIAALHRSGWRRTAFAWLESTEDGLELMADIAKYILAPAFIHWSENNHFT